MLIAHYLEDMETNIVPFQNSPRKGKGPLQICFDRKELSSILNVYGQMVSKGDWKDYALDTHRDRAIFSVFRKASEEPLYRIEKVPAQRRKQGQFQVVAPGGLILKRGQDLGQVLRVFDKQRFRTV